MAKSLLVKLGVLKPSVEDTSVETTEVVSPKPTRRTTSAVSENIPTKTESENEVRKALYKAMKACKKSEEGFGYMALCDALEKMAKVIPNADALYTAVQAMASSMNATAESLTLSSREYIKVLNQERTKFETEMKTLRDQCSNSQVRLEEIKKQIAVLQKEQSGLEEEVSSCGLGAEQDETVFNRVLEEMIQEVKDRVNTVKKYF